MVAWVVTVVSGAGDGGGLAEAEMMHRATMAMKEFMVELVVVDWVKSRLKC